MKKTLLAAGGDLRQIYAAEKLCNNFSVFVTGFDKNIVTPENISYYDNLTMISKRVDFLLLPMPVTTDGIMLNTPFCKNNIPVSQLISSVNENGIVFGGKIDESVKSIFTASGLEVIDYLEREEFSVLNAIPTAEGAVQIALEELATTIHGCNILITGFGRISKVLVKILTAMGAKVTVCARKYHDLAWADIYGCSAVHISELSKYVQTSDLVFNTVPHAIFDAPILKKVNKECLIIDLASKPGGVDFGCASEIGIKAVWALGLPGKVAPVSAGYIIADTITNILSERGMIYERNQ